MAAEHHAKTIPLVERRIVLQGTVFGFCLQVIFALVQELLNSFFSNRRIPTAGGAMSFADTLNGALIFTGGISAFYKVQTEHPLTDYPERAARTGTFACFIENNGEVPFFL